MRRFAPISLLFLALSRHVHSLTGFDPTPLGTVSATRTLSQESPSTTAFCTGCLIEAFNLLKLSYTDSLSVLGTTVQVTAVSTPYVYVYPDGHRSTSWSVSPVTFTIPQTFTLPPNATVGTSLVINTDLTWEFNGATLTWPTTYGVYTALGGATACPAKVTGVQLPATVDTASLVYPLGEGDAATTLPPALISYLNGLPEVMAQFSPYTDLANCETSVIPGRLPPRFAPRTVAYPMFARNDTWKRAMGSGSGSGTIAPTITSSALSSAAPQTHTSALVLTDSTADQIVINLGSSTPPTAVPVGQTSGNHDQSKPTGNGASLDTGRPNTDGQGSPHNTNGGDQNTGKPNTEATVTPAPQPGLSSGDASGPQHATNAAGSPQHTVDAGHPENTGGQSITIGTSAIGVVPAGSSSDVVIGTNTFKPGQATTIGTVVVSIPTGGGSVIVAGSTIPLNSPAPGATGNPVVTIGGHTITANPGGAFSIAPDLSLTPGGTAVVGGSTFSLGPSGSTVVIINSEGTRTVPLDGPTGNPVITIGDHTITANPSGAFSIAPGLSLTPGGTAVVGGNTFSLGPSGSTVVIVNSEGTRTMPLGGPTGNPVITIGDHTITANPSGAFSIAPGLSLTPGGTAVIGGSTFSLGPSGSTVVIINSEGTRTIPLGGPTGSNGPSVLTIGSSTITAGPSGVFTLGPNATLRPGGPAITISGTTYSIPPGGSSIIINGHTSTLGLPATITPPPTLTLDGTTFKPTVEGSSTWYVIASGVTLTPGGTITVDGTTYSLDPHGSTVVINGHTSTISRSKPASNSASKTSTGSTTESTTESTASSTHLSNIGDYIASGLGITKSGSGASTKGIDSLFESWIIGAAGLVLALL